MGTDVPISVGPDTVVVEKLVFVTDTAYVYSVDSFYVYNGDTVTVFDTTVIYIWESLIEYRYDTTIVVDTFYLPENYAFLQDYEWNINSANMTAYVQLSNDSGKYILGFNTKLYDPPPDSLKFCIRILGGSEADHFFSVYGSPILWHWIGSEPEGSVFLPADAVLEISLRKPYYLGKAATPQDPIVWLEGLYFIGIRAPNLDL
ncbi:hypothetical protein KKC06_00475 [Patescibacteria group bacterium]|nr:hypothetical protein [Patescibacteria group bacterium]